MLNYTSAFRLIDTKTRHGGEGWVESIINRRKRMKNSIEKLTDSIRNYSEVDLCLGTIRTLKMIDDESKKMQDSIDSLKAHIEKIEEDNRPFFEQSFPVLVSKLKDNNVVIQADNKFALIPCGHVKETIMGLLVCLEDCQTD